MSVTEVLFGADTVTVDVALRRRRLACPQCEFSTAARYDTRPLSSTTAPAGIGWSHMGAEGRWSRHVGCPSPRAGGHNRSTRYQSHLSGTYTVSTDEYTVSEPTS